MAVDDSTGIGEEVCRALQVRPGLRTLMAFSAGEGLSLLRAVSIDVIVVAHPLQQMSGIELMDRASLFGQRPRCILLAAEPDCEEVRAARTRGLVNCVISRPFRTEDVVLAVDLLLGMRGGHDP
jgi:DNA-binding response OmpR family regulator